MRGLVVLATALLLACPQPSTEPAPAPAPASAPASPRVQAALDVIDARVAELRREFDARAGEPRPAEVAWVKLRLSHLVEVDQYLRTVIDDLARPLAPDERQALEIAVTERLMAVDAAHTRELRSLLGKHGWFRISVFGEQADRDAWLLVQHADQDLLFQQGVLRILEDLYPKGETSPANFAYLFDRVAIARGRPQRYGTQAACLAGEWITKPLEQPEAVDSLRAAVGLPPLAEYEARGAEVCRTAVTP